MLEAGAEGRVEAAAVVPRNSLPSYPPLQQPKGQPASHTTKHKNPCIHLSTHLHPPDTLKQPPEQSQRITEVAAPPVRNLRSREAEAVEVRAHPHQSTKTTNTSPKKRF